jgi:hypothetical protein
VCELICIRGIEVEERTKGRGGEVMCLIVTIIKRKKKPPSKKKKKETGISYMINAR